MARPVKKTVDYFPHDCEHKQTMFIIEQKYGNDGYATWFKILEVLGNKEGHFIDCNSPETWEFLQAKTHLGNGLLVEIFDTLARLKAIDPALWSQKIIWSQNLVDRLAGVYKNRRQPVPTPPNPVSTDDNTSRKNNYKQKPQPDQVSTEESTQSKVKESKVKESKVFSSNPFIAKMQKALGYPETLKTDPIPNPAKEAAFIKKMQSRGFSYEEIFNAWQLKVNQRHCFVSMYYVNEDIGGHDAKTDFPGYDRDYPEPPE